MRKGDGSLFPLPKITTKYCRKKSKSGVRIDIWTHLMRGCIIMYTNLKGVCQKWQKEKYTMKFFKR